MARIVKSAEDRKAELVDCAERLFFEKGYEATTIADILARTQLSKGAFYHHYASKEELLDAVIERFARHLIDATHDVLKDESIDELTRLNQFFERATRFQYEAAPVWVGLYSRELKTANALLHERFATASSKVLLPVLTRILERGTSHGDFDAQDPGVIAEVILQLSGGRQSFVEDVSSLSGEGKREQAMALIQQRLAAERRLIERLLALPPGSVRFSDEGHGHAIISALARDG